MGTPMGSRWWKPTVVLFASLLPLGCDGQGGGQSAAGGGGNGAGGATTTGAGGATGGSTGVAGQGTGGDLFTSTTTAVPPGYVVCGDTACDPVAEYCLEEVPGVCCSDPAYSCVPLPSECQSPSADCACLEASECPCGAGSCQTPGIGKTCQPTDALLVFTCTYQ